MSVSTLAAPPSPPAPAGERTRPIRSRRPAPGEPFVWLTGAGLAIGILMVLSLMGLVLFHGALAHWPDRIERLELRDGGVVLGEPTRRETYRPDADELGALPPDVRGRIARAGGLAHRVLMHTGNYDLYGTDFRWVAEHDIVSRTTPGDAWHVERLEWGPAIGYPQRLEKDGRPIPGALDDLLGAEIARSAARTSRIRELERGEMGRINAAIESSRLDTRRAALRYGEDSPEHREAARRAETAEASLTHAYEQVQEKVEALREENLQVRLVMEDATGSVIPDRQGSETPLPVGRIVRAFPANTLSFTGRLGILADRWMEFLSQEPREANTEGGIFPAIFGTLMMTLMMSAAVAPFGVMAALYLREYAHQGAVVSAVRIAVNNLAGVPSIVYGVFGLGFFCYVVGGTIDEIFFPEKLPSPTFGTGGILWASLTLALLTAPVVIVSTEEALAAVPRSMREGSYACGASRWQTLRRIVLPRALPGIMTGLILAMARGAGEVAPLMITGVVKLAPDLPLDTAFPYLHLERSFMHLGFHIYDLGFQSRNSEAAKPMVFATTLLLIALVLLMNTLAISLRSRLKRRFRADQF